MNKDYERKQRAVTELSVAGYKSLRDPQPVRIGPLTLLAGANSSGKSSLVQPLLLMKQTLDARYDPGPLLLAGEHVRFSAADQMFSKRLGESPVLEFSVSVTLDNRQTLTQAFAKASPHGVEIRRLEYSDSKNPDQRVVLQPGMPSEEVQAKVPAGIRRLRAEAEKAQGTQLRWTVCRVGCFLGVGLVPVATTAEGVRDRLPGGEGMLLTTPGLFFEKAIQGIIHVPGLRGNPERTYPTTPIGPSFVGTFENYVASIIHHWRTQKDGRMDQLGQDLRELGLTWKVDAHRHDDTQVEILVGRLPGARRSSARDVVSIADVGFGLSQTLPVVVALLTAQPGQVVYIEQPETHLHPRAQVALAQLLVRAANRGVRVVAETHSSLLVLAVQTQVAQGRIRPEDVALHWFARRDDGMTAINSGKLDKAGAYGDWPQDFVAVEMETEARYLDAGAGPESDSAGGNSGT